MPQYAEKPSTITIHTVPFPNCKSEFIEWQAKINAQIMASPGFVSLEFLSPSKTQKGWLVIQRFSHWERATLWRESIQYRQLLEELETFAETLPVDESTLREGVTEVIVTEVSPEKEEAYRQWMAKIHQAEARFPGFCGMYVQPPSEGKNWITLLQFDSRDNLDLWLQSPERQKLLAESAPLISSLETHRVVSPYAGWFASIAKTGEIPSVWKQTMIVLLVLFPLVMLELKYLSPFTSGLDLSVATFIGNAISVTLIAFPMMPIAIWLLGWWLVPDSKKRRLLTLLGALTVGVLYLIEIALFWKFLSQN